MSPYIPLYLTMYLTMNPTQPTTNHPHTPPHIPHLTHPTLDTTIYTPHKPTHHTRHNRYHTHLTPHTTVGLSSSYHNLYLNVVYIRPCATVPYCGIWNSSFFPMVSIGVGILPGFLPYC